MAQANTSIAWRCSRTHMLRDAAAVVAAASVMRVDRFVVEGEVFAHEVLKQNCEDLTVGCWASDIVKPAATATHDVEVLRIEFKNVGVAYFGGTCKIVVILVVLLVHCLLFVFLFSGVIHR